VYNSVEEELDDHRDAINENTNEIQANYEYMCELDTKIEKLREMIHELHMCIGSQTPKNGLAFEIDNSTEFTQHEKEVFNVLYTFQEEEKNVTCKEIAQKLKMAESMVMGHILDLIQRGIPIVRYYADNDVCLKIDPYFKDMQTKYNILHINEVISAKVIS